MPPTTRHYHQHLKYIRDQDETKKRLAFSPNVVAGCRMPPTEHHNHQHLKHISGQDETQNALLSHRTLSPPAGCQILNAIIIRIWNISEVRTKHIVQINITKENKIMTFNNRTAHTYKTYYDNKYCLSLSNTCMLSVMLIQSWSIGTKYLYITYFYFSTLIFFFCFARTCLDCGTMLH